MTGSTVHASFFSPAAILRVTGEDAFDFLQGQFTNDLRGTAPCSWTYGCWLSHKGKVLGDSFIARHGSSWVLFSYDTPADTIRVRLESFIIADDVDVGDESAVGRGLAFWGEGAGDIVGRLGAGRIPAPGEWLETSVGWLAVGRRSSHLSFDLWRLNVDDGWEGQIREKLSEAGVAIVGESARERERIMAGIPKVPVDIGPGDLPQEGGLDRDAVSYTKGCFQGQEVMARIKNLGRVRRCLCRFRGKGNTPELPAGLVAGGRSMGELRSAVDDGDGWVGLGLVTIGGEGSGVKWTVGLPDGVAIVARVFEEFD